MVLFICLVCVFIVLVVVLVVIGMKEVDKERNRVYQQYLKEKRDYEILDEDDGDYR